MLVTMGMGVMSAVLPYHNRKSKGKQTDFSVSKDHTVQSAVSSKSPVDAL